MELTHLKAAAQLAEMQHNADPKNEAKKAAFEKAQAEYDQAAETVEEVVNETAPAGTGLSDALQTFDRQTEFKTFTIEELEAMLEAKKAAKAAESKPTDTKQTESKPAETTQTETGAGTSETAEDSKKNETPS